MRILESLTKEDLAANALAMKKIADDIYKWDRIARQYQKLFEGQ
jgi:hypothetical protein